VSSTEGQYHDLQEILELCLRHPVLGLADGRVSIQWGRTDTEPRIRKVLATYCKTTGLIEVTRKLDRPWVPSYFLRDLVGHEILHSLIPWKSRGDWHSDTFRRAEARLPGHARAELWLNRNVDRLLG
jgi:hypothetical protein